MTGTSEASLMSAYGKYLNSCGPGTYEADADIGRPN